MRFKTGDQVRRTDGLVDVGIVLVEQPVTDVEKWTGGDDHPQIKYLVDFGEYMDWMDAKFLEKANGVR